MPPSLVAKSKLPARQPLQGIFMPQALWNAPLMFWAYNRSRYHPPLPPGEREKYTGAGAPKRRNHALLAPLAPPLKQGHLRDCPQSPCSAHPQGRAVCCVAKLANSHAIGCALRLAAHPDLRRALPATTLRTASKGKHLVVYRPTHDFWHWCWGGWFSYYGWRPFQTHLFLCPGGSEGLVGPLAFLHFILQEQTS